MSKFKTFFAFSNEQFAKQKEDGVKYVSLGNGTICPKENVDEFLETLSAIQEKGVETDIAENGMDKIIKRELYNYEAFLGSVDLAIETFKVYNLIEDYKMKVEDIVRVFNDEIKKIDFDNY